MALSLSLILFVWIGWHIGARSYITTYTLVHTRLIMFVRATNIFKKKKREREKTKKNIILLHTLYYGIII